MAHIFRKSQEINTSRLTNSRHYRYSSINKRPADSSKGNTNGNGVASHEREQVSVKRGEQLQAQDVHAHNQPGLNSPCAAENVLSEAHKKGMQKFLREHLISCPGKTPVGDELEMKRAK